jgi:DNA-binding SARP family transcriptional activator/tetratricopeptide (TPR) repeat protein
MKGELQLALLGNLEIYRDGVPLTGLRSSKAQALLCFLAMTGRPHLRPTLAGLLWGELPEVNARGNLRKAVADLRRLLAPHLQISRQAIAFDRDSPYWLDVERFEAKVGGAATEVAIGELQEAVELYRGDFLEGFYVRQAPAFEEWMLAQQARLRELAEQALHTLVVHHTRQGEAGFAPAIHYTTRLLHLDPWREEAHRQLMLLLAHSGQRGAALAQYQACRRTLAEELGVEPAEQTTSLYERIRDGKLDGEAWKQALTVLPVPMAPPPFLSIAPARPYVPASFVARERELAQLDSFLDLALEGQGQVVFVSGEAGSGKTALVQAFARRVQDKHADLVVAGGNCNAHTGIGDPYLPFREILGLLTGDVEAEWAAGEISREHARRLWALMPHSVQALVSVAPDLVDILIPSPPLISRAQAASSGAGWLTDLEALAALPERAAHRADLLQSDLFQQYTRLLQALAKGRPLLLVLDDLQWADSGSLSLLFHLGRRLEHSPILIVGIYRSADVAMGRDGERHPLEAVVGEFQRRFGKIQIDLRQTGDQEFVDNLLDTLPNRLGTRFRKALYEQTKGHALFTVEMLRGMRERGELVQNERGLWVEGPVVDWEALPARVEGVIGERVARLPAALQETLKVASVEGEGFTAEVVARVRAVPELETVRQLSSRLDQRHRLVTSRGSQRVGQQRISRYRFRHILFQKYVYDSLSVPERAYLHEAIGRELERLHEGQIEEAAVRLARHFEEAGQTAKAVDYIHQAGRRAMRLSANEEAIGHFRRALGLLETLPDSPERSHKELALQMALAAPLTITKSYSAPETEQAYLRAQELCVQASSRGVGDTSQEFAVLRGLWNCYCHRGELRRAQSLAEQLLALAQKVQDPVLLMQAHWVLGENHFHSGELDSARAHLEQAIELYDPHTYHAQPFRAVQDPGPTCQSFVAQALWFLGYPDQALRRMDGALSLAQELAHPITLHHTLMHAVWLHRHRGEGQLAQAHAEAAFELATEHGWGGRREAPRFFLGVALLQQGEIEEGIALIRQTLDAIRDTKTTVIWTPWYLGTLAEANLKAGITEEGLVKAAEGLAIVDRFGTHFYEAGQHRIKGELLLQRAQADQGAENCLRDAERSFRQAIDIARQQDAKSLELRAAISLSRLWQAHGSSRKRKEARQMLAGVYGWFTEGFDTADLTEAKALLAELE